MTPSVSIVVPAYCAERYLAQALDSVLAQTFGDWELVVVDDGSPDRCGEIAAAYAAKDERIRVARQANAGVSAARNFGAAQTGADRLIFLDADDVWEPGALAHLSAALDARPDAPAVYGLARYIGADGEPILPGVCEGHQRFRLGLDRGRVIAWPDDRPTTFAVEAVMERVMTCGTVLLRRTAFKAAGGFDPALRMWEDWDFWLRVTERGGLVFTDTLVLGYRRHDGNVSGQLDLLEAGEWQVRRRLLERVKNDPAREPTARAGLAYRHRCAVSHRLADAKKAALAGHPAAAVRACAAAGRHLSECLRLR